LPREDTTGNQCGFESHEDGSETLFGHEWERKLRTDEVIGREGEGEVDCATSRWSCGSVASSAAAPGSASTAVTWKPCSSR
jgi:hypothetical protein